MNLRKKVSYLFCMSILQVLFLYGCGAGNQPANDPAKEPGYTGNADEYDLAVNEWKEFQQIEEADTKFVVVDYLEDFCLIPESGMTRSVSFSATDQDMYYRLQLYTLTHEDSKDGVNDASNVEGNVISNYEEIYYLYSLNTTTLETSAARVDLHVKEGLGNSEITAVKELVQALEEGNASVEDLDAAEGKLYLFTTVRDPEDNGLIHYYALRTDGEGTVEQLVDLLPAIQENIRLETKLALNMGTVTRYDPKGYYYVINGQYPEILVIDGEGKTQGMVALQDFADVRVMNTCKSPKGAPIFEYEDLNGRTVIFSLEGTEKKVLYKGENRYIYTRNIDAYGNVLYLENRKLVWWDAVQGSCRWVYDTRGIIRCEAILHPTVDEISVICEKQGRSYLYKFKEASEEIDPSQKEIVLLGRIDMGFTESIAIKYSETHPDAPITVQIPETVLNMDPIAFNRLIEEMKAGKGPDVIVVYGDQLIDLQKAGVLADLSDVLPKEIQEQMFLSAIQRGTIDGKLYGIAYEVRLMTCMVSDEVWEGDSWTIGDLLDVIRQREAEDQAPMRIFNGYYGETPDQTLALCCRNVLETSPFIDLEHKTCNFETEEFYELLRVCKKYGVPRDSNVYPNVGEMNGREREEVMNGDALTHVFAAGVVGYALDREALGDGYHCVGFPTEGENGSFATSWDCIAVNRNTEHWDVIVDFLQFVLSEEAQSSYSARRDLISKWLDGTTCDPSYTDEYLTLIDKAVPIWPEDEIYDIISEEAEAYFAGGKTEQEVAKIIQNRVQLYLDEHN